MNKKIVKTVLLLIFAFHIAHAQYGAHYRITASEGLEMTDSIVLTIWDNFVHSGSSHGSQYYRFLPINNEKFELTISEPNYSQRIKVVNSSLGMLIPFGLIEETDRVTINIKGFEGKNVDISYTGPGSAKFRFLQTIKSLKNDVDKIWLNKENRMSPKNLLVEFENLHASKLFELEGYQNDLSDTAYQIIKLDLLGSIRHYELLALTMGYTQAQGLLKQIYSKELVRIFSNMDTQITSDFFVFSPNFREYLYQKEKLALLFAYNPDFTFNQINFDSPFSFEFFYDHLQSKYEGKLRDWLLAYCLINPKDIQSFFGGVNPDEYARCFHSALNSINDKALLDLIKGEEMAKNSGKPAFNFSLPNSEGQTVKLSDFNGKVVLLDFWGTGCGACILFKQKFETEIYPILKLNPDFVFISINTDRKREMWLKSLPKYSNPDFVNLGLFGLGQKHPMVEHYNIKSLPFLLLVGKSGEVISSTLPHDTQLLFEVITNELH